MRNRGSITTNARKRKPKTRAKVSALRADPTRSLTLRRQMAVRVRNMFAKLRLELYRLIVDEDELGLRDRHLIRNNCGIGPDGFEAGNDCAAGGGGGGRGDNWESVQSTANPSSPKFKTWFGKSKVVSTENKPLVVYHGATQEFEAFNKGPAFFSSEPKVAESFAKSRAEHAGEDNPKPRLIAAHLKIEKPKIIHAKGVAAGEIQFSSFDKYGYRAALNNPKYDGVIIKGTKDEGDLYIVKTPKQIKSAHQNKGEFSKDSDSIYNVLSTNADAWRFNSDPEKLQKFQEWLRRQLQQFLVGRTQEELWRVYTEQGIKKGAARSFEDARGIEKLKDAGTALAFYAGTKEEFLRSSFRQPESVSKIQLLASRTFTDLKNVTEDMATRMSRTLVDGLTAGQGPRQIAVKLDADLDIGRTRALTIARTEIIRAHAEGQLLALEQLGVQEVGAMVEWSTAGDERVCPLCKPLEGVVLKLDEAKGMLPRHPNCRCAWIPANVGEDQKTSKTTKGQITKSVTKSQELEGQTSWGPGQAIAKKRPESILNVAARFSTELSRITQE